MSQNRKPYRRANGEGSLRFRKDRNRWEAQFKIGKLRTTRYFITQEESRRWLLRQRMDMPEGFLSTSEDTLYDYLIIWFEKRKPNPNDPSSLAITTYQLYERVMEDFILPYWKDNPINLTKVKKTHINSFIDHMVKEAVRSRYRQIAYRILHKALNDAVGNDLIGKNPASNLNSEQRLKVRHIYRRSSPISPSQIQMFLRSIKDPSFYALYALACICGTREGEILGLSWGEIDWDNRRINIQQQVIHQPSGKFNFGDPKTEAGKRPIHFGDDILNILLKHREMQVKVRQEAGEKWKDYNLVFPTSVGTPYNPSNLRRRFIADLKKAGLPRIRFQDLRHSNGRAMVSAGINIVVAKERLGHTDIRTTQIYSSSDDVTHQIAADQLENLILPEENGIMGEDLSEQVRLPQCLQPDLGATDTQD